jgi:hypothetical protein
MKNLACNLPSTHVAGSFGSNPPSGGPFLKPSVLTADLGLKRRDGQGRAVVVGMSRHSEIVFANAKINACVTRLA